MNNKKGMAIELIAFIVIGIISVLFFGGLIYGVGLVSNTMSGLDVDINGANVSSISGQTMGQLSSGMNGLQLISFVMIIGYMLATFIVAYFSGRHPLWLFVYILITIMLVIFSIYISNAYDTMKQSDVVASMTQGFGMSEMVINYLPVWVTVIGLFGITISIVGITISRRLTE